MVIEIPFKYAPFIHTIAKLSVWRNARYITEGPVTTGIKSTINLGDDRFSNLYARHEALQNLARRVESEELNLMVFSTIITRELGGDISEIFDHLADVIRSRHRVMERVETLTAQGRLQAMVCGAIPFVLYGILFLWQPEYIQPLFNSNVGRVAIYAVVLFQVMVILIVRRIVNIRI